MPIWKADDDTLMIEIGFGDVVVASGKVVDKNHDDELIFYTGAKGEIGAENAGDIGKLTTEVKTRCRIVFHDPRSIDVVLHHLNALKSTTLAKPEPAALDKEKR